MADDLPEPLPAKPVSPTVATLRDARIDEGLSQRDLAYVLGTQQSQVSAWESGNVVPSLESVMRWAEALGFRLALLSIEDSVSPVKFADFQREQGVTGQVDPDTLAIPNLTEEERQRFLGLSAEDPGWVGRPDRECGEHRTTINRAWCLDCHEWCYSAAPCARCELPALRAEVETLRRTAERAQEHEAARVRAEVESRVRDASDLATVFAYERGIGEGRAQTAEEIAAYCDDRVQVFSTQAAQGVLVEHSRSVAQTWEAAARIAREHASVFPGATNTDGDIP